MREFKTFWGTADRNLSEAALPHDGKAKEAREMRSTGRLNSKKGCIPVAVGMAMAALVFVPACLLAMENLCDEALGQVTAQAGITYNYGDFGVHVGIGSYRFSDTDSSPRNWIEFNNVTISGPGGYFLLDCPQDYPMTIDVATSTTIDDQGLTFIEYQMSDHVNRRDWSVGNFVFCNQDLGSITFDTSTVDPAVFRVSSHRETGSSGIDFEYLFRWRTQDFTYAYNTSGGSLHVAGLHLAETAGGDPSDPSTWTFTGPFRVGDLYGGTIDTDNDPSNQAHANPATFDVATVDDKTYVLVNLPLKGSIRMEGVSMNGMDFGPVAIDGIKAHVLSIKINPE